MGDIGINKFLDKIFVFISVTMACSFVLMLYFLFTTPPSDFSGEGIVNQVVEISGVVETCR